MAIPPRWRGSSFGGCSPFTCYGSSWSRCSSWCSCRWTSSASIHPAEAEAPSHDVYTGERISWAARRLGRCLLWSGSGHPADARRPFPIGIATGRRARWGAG